LLAERKVILEELCQVSIRGMAKSQYAHFVRSKPSYCHSIQLASLIVKAMKGNMAGGACRCIASGGVAVLEHDVRHAQTGVLYPLLAFGTMLLPFRDNPTSPRPGTDKKRRDVDFVRNPGGRGEVSGLLSESTRGLPAGNSCLTPVGRSRRFIAIDSIRERVVAVIYSLPNAKDRKRILKSLKGHTRSGFCTMIYRPLSVLVQLTDDTVSIHKTCNELDGHYNQGCGPKE
jgi:hypothetical protein